MSHLINLALVLLMSNANGANFVEDLLTMAVPPYNEKYSSCKTNKDCRDATNTKYQDDYRWWLNNKEIYREANQSDYRGHQDKDIKGRQCLKWPPKLTKGKYRESGTSTLHNYCRNPEGKKQIYCYYGSEPDEYEYCEKLTYDDMKLQCALLEPFSINNSNISMKESRLMRTLNCIPEKDCNKYDKNNNYYASCK